MSRNAFQRLATLRPDAPVLVGRVVAHNSDDTSDVQLPASGASLSVNGVVHGATIRARGTHVPVGLWACVRRGRIETATAVAPSQTHVVGESP